MAIRRNQCKTCQFVWKRVESLHGCLNPRKRKFMKFRAEFTCSKYKPVITRRAGIEVEGKTLAEICSLFTQEGLLHCTDRMVRDMYDRLGIRTIRGLRQRAVDRKPSNVSATKFDVTLPDGTPAQLTAREIWEIHPHRDDVVLSTVQARLNTGTGLWQPKRGTTNLPIKRSTQPKKVVTIVKAFDRNLACYGRSKDGTIHEKCFWYWELTETFGMKGKPARCLKATDVCENYKGEKLKKVTVDMSCIQHDPELMPKHDKFMGTGVR